MKTQETRAQTLEKKIDPGVDRKTFFSYNYIDEAEFQKAIKDYKILRPESKIKIFEFIGSYENSTGGTTHKTMFKNKGKRDD